MRRDGQVNTHIDYFFFLNSHFFFKLRPYHSPVSLVLWSRFGGAGGGPRRSVA